ncbi:MAG: CopD family protein [Bergeyella sp.]
MLYLIIKALHIIFMVSYFAGIFYLVRLFVYYKDTDEFETEKSLILREQYIFMMRRLWNIIIAPAGIMLILINSALMKADWFHLKLLFLIGLLVYHLWCRKTIISIKNLKNTSLKTPTIKLRQYNEIATFILFLVVFTVILKASVVSYWWQLIAGFAVLVTVIILTVKLVNLNKK